MEDFSLIRFLLVTGAFATTLFLFISGKDMWRWWKYGAEPQDNFVKAYFYTYLFVAIPFLLLLLFDDGGSVCIDAGRWGGVNC